MEKCKVIAIANQKGGVGKTTTTLNVAIGMARNGYDVLIIDFDPQGDLTSSLGWKTNDALENSVSSMLDDYINDESIHYDSLILNHPEAVDVIPANIELADFEMRLVSVINREQTLSNCIEPLRSKYDYIFIDCPPSLGMLTVNALAAADEVLIPVQTQYLPAKGMTKLLQTVNKVQRKINGNLKINGIVMTLADSNTNITKSTIETIRNSFSKNIKVFDTIIPKATKASEASTSGKSIYEYAKDSKVALAYESLTKEIMNKEYSVLYFSAPQLFNTLAKNAFDKNDIDAHNMCEYIFDCDLLIIDDLGTEYTNAFIASQFFTCINERLLHRKSTIISTNLSLESLADLYTERSFSRITSRYSLLKIVGDDIRIKKKLEH